MILTDTSVWVEYFREGNETLKKLLHLGQVAIHPFVIGELACGKMNNREQILNDLQILPTVQKAADTEILLFIDTHHIMNSGVGLIDVHLLASSLLSSTPLWTFDKKLHLLAKNLHTAYEQR